MGVELPEALILAKQMNEELEGKIIKSVHLKNYASLLRMGFINLEPNDFEARLVSKSIDSVTAKGKWIFVALKPDMQLLLGEMMGKVLYHSSQEKEKPYSFGASQTKQLWESPTLENWRKL